MSGPSYDPRLLAPSIVRPLHPGRRAARSTRNRAALGNPEGEGVDQALTGPLGAEVSWSHYRIDSAVRSSAVKGGVSSPSGI